MSAGGRLPPAALPRVRTGMPAVLVTVGRDGLGHAVLTWAAAPASTRIRFGVDHHTRTLANLRRLRRATLQLIGRRNLLLLVKGPARQLRAQIAATSLPMAVWELTVRDVRDQRFPGVVVAPLTYRWVGRRRAIMRRMERAVYRELAGRAGPAGGSG